MVVSGNQASALGAIAALRLMGISRRTVVYRLAELRRATLRAVFSDVGAVVF